MSKYGRKCYTFLFLIIVLFTYGSLSFANQLTPQTTATSQTLKNVEGTLEIRLASYLDEKRDRPKNDIIEYALKVNDNLTYSLIFKDHVPDNLQTGQHIRILEGTAETSVDGTQKLIVLAKNLIIVRDLTLKEIPDAFGRQKTLVMLVNFQNQPTNMPWTLAQVKDVVFNTINNMFYEFSYQQTTVVGDVIGWYTVPLNNTTSCTNVRNYLPSLAKDAATRAGVDLSLYTRFVYIFPRVVDCTWAGLGSVGGKPSTAWINGINRADVTAHELGHNLGLYHSHSLECQGSSSQGTCIRVEYGDYADTMGYPYVYSGSHFNAFQKERLGWLNFTTSPPVQTVTTSGTYTIDPYETTNRNVKALKIVKRAYTNGSKDYYYLELRQGIGFDKNLSTCTDCDFTKGVLVHQANSANSNSSDMLDMSPFDSNKSKLVTLLPGKTLKDANAPNGGVTITVLSVSSTGASVKVTFGDAPPPPPPSCIRALPTMTSSPREIVVVRGQSAKYTISIRNNDSTGCGSSNFAFSVNKVHDQVPVLWSPTSASIAPGATQAISVTANTSVNTPTGYFLIRTNGVSVARPQYAATVTSTIGVRA